MLSAAEPVVFALESGWPLLLKMDYIRFDSFSELAMNSLPAPGEIRHSFDCLDPFSPFPFTHANGTSEEFRQYPPLCTGKQFVYFVATYPLPGMARFSHPPFSLIIYMDSIRSRVGASKISSMLSLFYSWVTIGKKLPLSIRLLIVLRNRGHRFKLSF